MTKRTRRAHSATLKAIPALTPAPRTKPTSTTCRYWRQHNFGVAAWVLLRSGYALPPQPPGSNGGPINRQRLHLQKPTRCLDEASHLSTKRPAAPHISTILVPKPSRGRPSASPLLATSR